MVCSVNTTGYGQWMQWGWCDVERTDATTTSNTAVLMGVELWRRGWCQWAAEEEWEGNNSRHAILRIVLVDQRLWGCPINEQIPSVFLLWASVWVFVDYIREKTFVCRQVHEECRVLARTMWILVINPILRFNTREKSNLVRQRLNLNSKKYRRQFRRTQLYLEI